MNKSLVLLLVVAMLGAVGCAAVESESSVAIASAAQEVESPAGAGLAASTDDVTGWWKAVHGGAGVMHIEEDGALILFYDQEPLADGPRATGEVRREGSRFLIAETAWGDDEVCEGAGTYEVELLANGYIKFIAIEDDCQRRMDALQGKGSLSGGIAWRPPFD